MQYSTYFEDNESNQLVSLEERPDLYSKKPIISRTFLTKSEKYGNH